MRTGEKYEKTKWIIPPTKSVLSDSIRHHSYWGLDFPNVFVSKSRVSTTHRWSSVDIETRFCRSTSLGSPVSSGIDLVTLRVSLFPFVPCVKNCKKRTDESKMISSSVPVGHKLSGPYILGQKSLFVVCVPCYCFCDTSQDSPNLASILFWHGYLPTGTSTQWRGTLDWLWCHLGVIFGGGSLQGCSRQSVPDS